MAEHVGTRPPIGQKPKEAVTHHNLAFGLGMLVASLLIGFGAFIAHAFLEQPTRPAAGKSSNFTREAGEAADSAPYTPGPKRKVCVTDEDGVMLCRYK